MMAVIMIVTNAMSRTAIITMAVIMIMTSDTCDVEPLELSIRA